MIDERGGQSLFWGLGGGGQGPRRRVIGQPPDTNWDSRWLALRNIKQGYHLIAKKISAFCKQISSDAKVESLEIGPQMGTAVSAPASVHA